MKKINIEILPGIGIHGLKFGSTKQQVEIFLGLPDERDTIDAEDEMLEEATVWHYWDLYLSVFFSGDNHNQLVAFETDHLEAVLFQKKIFKMNEKQLIDLLKEKKIYDLEEDTEPWGEKRLTFHDLGMDFYYDGNRLETINWSAWYDENNKMVFPEQNAFN
ncbi:MAG: hypothetical protein PHQ65_07155 [Bacteroidales bacterium]|nr:hypothetical protein [Bacteroidales bacterium]MDD3665024.1 hypothetical protein [Bacteroidales bacterium]